MYLFLAHNYYKTLQNLYIDVLQTIYVLLAPISMHYSNAEFLYFGVQMSLDSDNADDSLGFLTNIGFVITEKHMARTWCFGHGRS